MDYLNGNLRIMLSEQNQDHLKIGYYNNGCLGAPLSFNNSILDFFFPKGNITSITTFKAVKKEKQAGVLVDSSTEISLDETKIVNKGNYWVHEGIYTISETLTEGLWEYQLTVVDSLLGSINLKSEVIKVKNKTFPTDWITSPDWDGDDWDDDDWDT